MVLYIYMNSGSADLPEREVFYPKEENLGKSCMYWGIVAISGCNYPKVELQGRTSCEGIIDDVCLFIKDGREPLSLTPEQQIEIKTRIPGLDSNLNLPPGETV